MIVSSKYYDAYDKVHPIKDYVKTYELRIDFYSPYLIVFDFNLYTYKFYNSLFDYGDTDEGFFYQLNPIS